MKLPVLRKTECPALLSAFFDSRLNASRRDLQILIVLSGGINLLLLIPDLILLDGPAEEIPVTVLRLVFSSVLLFLFFRIERIRSFQRLSLIITGCEFFALAVYLFVFTRYSRPDFLIQTLGLITLIIFFFFVPNRLEYKLGAASVGALAFFGLAYARLPSLDAMEFWTSVFYALLILLLCAVSSGNAEKYQFREYLAKAELERISSTDCLTNTANRYKLTNEANRWLEFCRRRELPLSLVFIDVDDLKKINDQYGHSKGDYILACLAQLISDHLRSSDLLARWGGDEFVLLLPETSLEQARNITERIREQLREQIRIREKCVTCSFGIVEMSKNADFDTMLQEADRLMYRVKKEGKDNIRSSE